MALFEWSRYEWATRVAGAVAVASAVFFGTTVALLMRHLVWKRVGQVAPADRVTVAAAVRTGEAIRESRLAPTVVAYASVFVARLESDARRRADAAARELLSGLPPSLRSRG
jgi:hypothetical protein